jgi:REP element-mobilizing transposase RayT
MHIPGRYYHVYNRGVDRQPIFASEENYRFLLRRAKRYLKAYDLAVIAYCLMPNHYHLLLRPEEDDALSRFIQRLFNSYTQAFNKQERRSGTLFEGRAKSILVDDERYVLHLCRYIHLNPVKAQLVKHPGEWLYSNYLEWVGERPGILVDRDFVQAYFPAPSDYASFVEGDINELVESKLRTYCLE